MKKGLLHLLIFAYVASIVKPVMPYISDCIAHNFYYAEHVRTVHMENEKYHVHNELVRRQQQHPNENADESMRKISFPDEHLQVLGGLELLLIQAEPVRPSYTPQRPPFRTPVVPSPPPRLVLTGYLV